MQAAEEFKAEVEAKFDFAKWSCTMEVNHCTITSCQWSKKGGISYAKNPYCNR